MVPLAAAAGFAWMATDELILARTISATFSRDAPRTRRPARAPLPAHTVRARWRVDRLRVPRPRAVGLDRLHVCRAGRPRPRAQTTSSGGWSKRAAATANEAAGKTRSFRSSSTAKTPGSISRAAAVRSCARSTRDSRTHPGAADGHHGRGLRGSRRRELPGIFPGRGSTRTSTSGSATPTISALEPARRGAAGARRSATARTDAPLAGAREEVLIAEGSDWFWWYGDDHSSAHDLEFDDLFRRHVRNAYHLMQKPVPTSCSSATSAACAPPAIQTHPTAWLSPTLDGDETSYFEWLGRRQPRDSGDGRRDAPRRRAAADSDARAVRLRP